MQPAPSRIQAGLTEGRGLPGPPGDPPIVPFRRPRLSLLLTARVIYRFAQLYFLSDPFDESVAGFGRSPLTLVIVATLAGYYGAYAIGLLRRMYASRPPVG